MSDPKAAGSNADAFVIAADLSPAAAADVRTAALAKIAATAGAGAALSFDLDADRPTPCALQLIVAATQSAKAAGIAVSSGATASEAMRAAGLN